MAEKIVIAQLDIETKGLEESAAKTAKEIAKIREEQSALRKETNNLTTATNEQSKKYVENDVQLKKLNASYNTAKTILAERVTGVKGLNTALNEQITTEGAAERSNKRLRAIRKEINQDTEEGRQAVDLINKKIDENNSFIEKNVDSLSKQKIGIGRYAEGVKEGIEQSGLLDKVFGQLGISSRTVVSGFNGAKAAVDGIKGAVTNYREASQEAKKTQEAFLVAQKSAKIATEEANKATETATQIGFLYSKGKATETEVEAANTAATKANAEATEKAAVAQKAAAVATDTSTASLKLFKIALATTGIGAIVIVLGSLITFLTTTQEGIDKLRAVTLPLQAVFQSFLGVVQNLGKNLFQAFSNPKQTLIDLGDIVKQNLINRFTAFGKILEGIINLDFKQVADGVLQAGTGVENVTDKVKNLGKQTAASFSEAIAKGSELNRLTIDFEKTQIRNRALIAELGEEFKAQNKIAEDVTKTTKEREEAVQASIEASKEINRLRLQELDLEIQILKNKQARNDTDREGEKELAELIAKRNEANATALEQQTTQQNKLNTIRQQAATNEIKRLNEELALFIANENVKNKTAEERIATEDEVSKKRLEILDREFKNGIVSKQKYEEQKLLIDVETSKKQAEIAVENLQIQAEIWALENKTRLDGQTELNKQLVQAEEERLQTLFDKEREINQKRFDEGLISQEEYYKTSLELDQQFESDKKEIKKAYAEQLREERAEQLAIDYEEESLLRDERNASQFEKDLARVNFEEEQKILAIREKQEEDKAFRLEQLELDKQTKFESDEEEAEYLRQFEARKAKIKREIAEQSETEIINVNRKAAIARNQIDQAAMQAKLQGAIQVAQGIAGLAGTETAIGKAAAIAATTISTYQSATSAFSAMSGIPIVGPILGGVAAAAAIAAGLANVSKIVRTDTNQAANAAAGLGSVSSGIQSIGKANIPKAEKGALFKIGGQRHTAGGTKFKGEDGTQFEAEKGELIGVMNRNAASAFMEFNNSFGAGLVGRSGTFQSGGTFTPRNIGELNTAATVDYDVLAMKISEANATLPVPRVVVAVEDINTGQEQFAEVVDGANVV